VTTISTGWAESADGKAAASKIKDRIAAALVMKGKEEED
jgi:hypothetical protein